VAAHRGELIAQSYRACSARYRTPKDASQEALLGAWRGSSGFEGRSSLRAWLYRVTTNACLRLIARRPSRKLSLTMAGPGRPPTISVS